MNEQTKKDTPILGLGFSYIGLAASLNPSAGSAHPLVFFGPGMGAVAQYFGRRRRYRVLVLRLCTLWPASLS
jgi:hypothetical protein